MLSLQTPTTSPHLHLPRRRRLSLRHCTAAKARPGMVKDEEEDTREYEMKVAVSAVQMACSLCQRVQEELLVRNQHNLKVEKEDLSPVTVADWAVQATISYILTETFGSETTQIIAEEDETELTNKTSSSLLNSVVTFVNQTLTSASQFGLKPPKTPLKPSQILQLIQNCNSTGGSKGRFWVLDPVDGTLGFIRGDQYAVALALIENGEVILGVLGCPNYPMKKEWLNYHQKYYRLLSKLVPPEPDSWHKGCVLFAKKGDGNAWMQPLTGQSGNLEGSTRIQVSDVSDPALATFCEPVEKANSSHSFTAGLVHSVGVKKQPLRVYSMVKYAAIARGDAEIFMKFAKSGYKEKIWDHAAGVVIIEEAGGVVSDARGRPLDFSKGLYLQGMDRGIIACSGSLLHQRIIGAVDASWDSSEL